MGKQRTFIKPKHWPVLAILFAAMSFGATPERMIYSNASNKELKQRVFRLVKGIRDLVDSYNRKDRQLMADYDKKARPEIRIDERKLIRDQWIKESDSVHDSTIRYYRDHYLSDAVLLLDELYKRVPRRMRQPNLLPMYQHPTNVLGLEVIANHLEVVAKSLPDS